MIVNASNNSCTKNGISRVRIERHGLKQFGGVWRERSVDSCESGRGIQWSRMANNRDRWPFVDRGWEALSRGARARARGIYLAETVAITSFPWELFGNRWGKFPRTGWPAQPRFSSQLSPAAHTLHRQCNNSIFLPTHLHLSLPLFLSRRFHRR